MTQFPASTGAPDYPVRFAVDYPDQRDRMTTALRLIWVIPIAIVLAALSPGTVGSRGGSGVFYGVAGAGGVVVVPVVFMLLFRRKYPAWWWDWNLQFTRFGARVVCYLLLLRDEYPATDAEQGVHLEIEAPQAESLNRWLPLVKWFLAIPHYILLFVLGLAVIVITIGAWFAILFTGRYPEDMFGFTVGVLRWGYRVTAYAFLLTTDRYPPFSMQ